VTGPLAWLLLSALALLAPPADHGPAQWKGRPLAVVTSPSQPTEGTPVRVVVALLPAAASDVVVSGGGHRATARPAGSGLRRATLTTPAAGPLTLTVRFTLHGRRYVAPGGVIFVVPDTSVQ
jgi:hypothetical protein